MCLKSLSVPRCPSRPTPGKTSTHKRTCNTHTYVFASHPPRTAISGRLGAERVPVRAGTPTPQPIRFPTSSPVVSDPHENSAITHITSQSTQVLGTAVAMTPDRRLAILPGLCPTVTPGRPCSNRGERVGWEPAGRLPGASARAQRRHLPLLSRPGSVQLRITALLAEEGVGALTPARQPLWTACLQGRAIATPAQCGLLCSGMPHALRLGARDAVRGGETRTLLLGVLCRNLG